jgi:hypothetical protein
VCGAYQGRCIGFAMLAKASKSKSNLHYHDVKRIILRIKEKSKPNGFFQLWRSRKRPIDPWFPVPPPLVPLPSASRSVCWMVGVPRSRMTDFHRVFEFFVFDEGASTATRIKVLQPAPNRCSFTEELRRVEVWSRSTGTRFDVLTFYLQ